ELSQPLPQSGNQVWIPLAQDPLFSVWMTRPPQEHWMAVIARVRPDVSFAQVQAELDAIGAQLANEFPAEKEWAFRIQPLQQTITGDVKLPLLLLLGGCGIGALDCVCECRKPPFEPGDIAVKGSRDSNCVGRGEETHREPTAHGMRHSRAAWRVYRNTPS